MPPFKRKINIGGEEIEIPNVNRNFIWIGAAVVLLLVLLTGTFYQIGPEEMGVILRFGQYVRITDPGLHFKIPLGLEKLVKVPVQRQLKEEFGFRTAKAGIRTQYRITDESLKEAMMLTGDLSVAVVEWIVQYKIRDPYKYLFKLRDARSTFRYMNEAVVRKIVGDNSVDEVITIGRARLALQAKEELQALCDNYEIGIEVNQLIFQDVNPPDPVKPSFNEVNEALQEKERKINEAWAAYNMEIPKAQGEAEQMIREAEGYAMERVNRAKGDADRFVSIYREYSRAPAVTRRRMYLETLSEVLPKIKKKVILDDKEKSVLPLLNLGREVSK
ncbi:HflK protein [bacterium I07]|nr:HflK protein [bacterium I07]